MRSCEVVYHHAALASVVYSLEAPLESHATNAVGTLNVLEAARREGVRRVIHASSSAVYGDTSNLPTAEAELPRPLSPYAVQKVTGELYCAQFTRVHGLETVALRYFNVFGPRQNPASQYAAVIPLFVTALAKGDSPRIFGDGQQTRDFVYVDDAVAANRAAALAPAECAGEVINVARGCRVSLLGLLRELCVLSGKADLQPLFEPVRPGDIRHSQADIAKALRLLDWRPQTTLTDGLRETLRYFIQGSIS